jgi:DNA recombination protein RmuC
MEFVYGFIAGSVLSIIICYVLLRVIRGSFVTTTHETVNNTLEPFKNEINEYKKSLDLTREKNIENTANLKGQIQNMMLLSQTMKEETRDLTQALKGDVKSQGNWGEIILERSIEISGLQKGREYTLQGEGLGLKDDDGNHYKPDAIIHLPNSLHLIIDSKVSLKSLYQDDYKELQRSITKHIDDLSSKAYQKLKGVSSPDYVIMFLPLESIMPILFSEFPEILEYASKKNITLATPISLLPILKTVGSLWRVDSQDKNGIEIARKAGLLYDKFVSLYDGLKETDEAIERLQRNHKESLKRLSDGKGNLVSRIDELKEMGAKTTKSLDP